MTDTPLSLARPLRAQVQINAQGMIDMAVGESEDTFIVSTLSRPRASEYALHQIDFRFQEGNHTKTVGVHPRDPLCVIDGRLIGSHPRLIQVGEWTFTTTWAE